MAPKSLRTLRAEAKRAGIAGFKGMDRDELISALSRPVKKRRATSAPAKRKTAKRPTTARTTKRGPGRPRKTAKPAAAKKRAPRATAASNGDSGRNTIGTINFSDDEGWNARDGSPRDQILKALKAKRGNRESVFNLLVKRIRDFVPLRKADGSKRSKAEQEAYLRYQISRVLFDFAVKTGQHEPSANRVEYGTGGTGTGSFKRAKRNSKPAPAPKKRGRPKGSTSTRTTKPRRGRPPGSKNKRTTASKTTKRRRTSGARR